MEERATNITTNINSDEIPEKMTSYVNFDHAFFKSFQIPITFSYYLNECVWPGLGLFGESYLLFSMGTLKPLWEELYPRCLGGYSCPLSLIYQLGFSIISGIICGMISIGYLSTSIGRRAGSILTASLMCGGSIGLLLITVVLAKFPLTLFRFMMVFLFIFGIGVGGEYPLSASSASERAMSEFRMRQESELNYDHDEILASSRYQQSTNSIKLNTHYSFRGGRILLVFAMQGIGVFVQSFVLCILLYIALHLGENNHGNYFTVFSLLTIWRIVYFIGAVILIYVYRFRTKNLKESMVWEGDRRQREEMKSLKYDRERGNFIPPNSIHHQPQSITKSVHAIEDNLDFKMLLGSFGTRLIGTSLSWFLGMLHFMAINYINPPFYSHSKKEVQRYYM